MSSKLKLPTLLLITEDPTIRHWIKKYLDDQFFILEATHERSALSLTQTNALDFIILDGHLEDPLDLSQKLRQVDRITPILLITGRLKKSYRDQALEAGVTDFLSAEIDRDELETRIATGRKAALARDKTTEMSALIKKQAPQELTLNYFKNRLLLNEKTLHLLAEAKEKNKPLTLLVLHVDHFDLLETQSSLATAEELLLALSERLQRHLRPEDHLIPSTEGRLILLLPSLSPAEARARADAIRRDIQQFPFPHQKRLTLSIAFSTFEGNETQYKTLLAQATQALKPLTNQILSLDKEAP